MTSHLTGHKLEDFVKLNKLGEGTYGVVFKVCAGILCSNMTGLSHHSGPKQEDGGGGGHEEDKTRV